MSQENAAVCNSGGDTLPLIEELLRQEQRSRHYQERLQSQIYAVSTDYQKVRAYCLQLQRMVSGEQHHKSQLEASLAYMLEACRVMARDLELERTRVQALESCLNDLYPKVDSLLQELDNYKTESLSNEVNGHLLLENQQQQTLVTSLESKLYAHEQVIQELKASLGNTLQSGRHSQGELGQSTIEEAEGQDDGSSSEGSCIEIITE